MFKNTVLFLLATVFAVIDLSAQDKEPAPEDENNLVPNGSFENYEGSLRRYGQFDLVNDWTIPSDNPPDLFASGIKSRYVAIPENMYGNESPADGETYAGIVAFSPRGKETRTYLSVKLKEKLKANTLYCVRYQVSLAERSRVASNNLGAYFDKSDLKGGSGSITKSDYISDDRNKVMINRDGWEQICGRFAAKGGEQYLTIGNFASDDRTSTENMELPSQYEEAGSYGAAYYYIDDVQVNQLAAGEDCGCASTQIPESKVIYSGTTTINDDMTLSEKMAAISAYFYQYKPEVVSAAERTVDKVIDMMKQNPMLKVQIVGHTDNEEAELAKKESSLKDLGLKRAQNIQRYMESQGIERSRLTAVSEENAKPISTMSTPISLAKNRRAEFKINL